ncbi:hypothetical protein BF28_5824 (plasmid) [Bacillus cereus E33L]|nr:hypothetical protein BF28_5824 [Bacillus cereus E33L]
MKVARTVLSGGKDGKVLPIATVLNINKKMSLTRGSVNDIAYRIS